MTNFQFDKRMDLCTSAKRDEIRKGRTRTPKNTKGAQTEEKN